MKRSYIALVAIALILLMLILIPSPPEEELINLSTTLDVAQVKAMLPEGIDPQNITIRPDEGYILIVMPSETPLSWNMWLHGVRMDSIKIYKNLFNDPRVNTVAIEYLVEVRDKYGNTGTDTGAIYTMKRTTADQIVWDNFITDDLDYVIDTYWVRPGIPR